MGRRMLNTCMEEHFRLLMRSTASMPLTYSLTFSAWPTIPTRLKFAHQRRNVAQTPTIALLLGHHKYFLPFSRDSPQFFVINVHRGEICLFWADIPDGYIESMRDTGRPPKTMRVTLYQGNKFPLFMRDGLAGFIREFKNLYPRLIQSGEK